MTDTDLLVAGAGGGLAGALRAAQLGCDVLVVEANEHFLHGNNTSMSTAMIPGAGSRYQQAAGIEDSPDRMLDDIRRKTKGTAEPQVARALTEVSSELVEWIADYVGLPLELATDFEYPGHSVHRVHTSAGRHGSELLRALVDATAADPHVEQLRPARLVSAHPDDGGLRALIERPDGSREEITTAALLLASNGYGADRALVAEHLPEIAGAVYHGSEYSRGDALRIGGELGAQAGYLDAYQGHAGLSAARTLVTWATVMHGAIMVNAEGRRFGDETGGYSEYAALLAEQSDAMGWIVLDERIHRLCLPFTDYRDTVDSGVMRSAESVAELARAMSVPAEALQAELSEASAVATGRSGCDRFGRSFFEAPLAPPWKAVRVQPALFHTQGGLIVDRHARVLDRAARPIPGLYASGGAATGISGHGASGYLAGNGLLSALGLAYLAAAHADTTRRTAAAPNGRHTPQTGE